MTDLLRIEEPDGRPRAAPQWRAFLELGFRPLYLAGCIWAVLAVGLWIFAPRWLSGPLGGLAWHAHEMLWGFIATIAVGFLLTAGSNWTGVNPLRGRALAGLLLLWVVARASYLLPLDGGFLLAAVSELLFFGAAAVALGRVIYGTRSRRNFGVPVLVLGLGAADALFLHSVWQGDLRLAMERFNSGLLCMAVIAMLVARRVIPFFATRAIPGLKISMHTRSGHWQLAAGALAIASSLVAWNQAMAVCLIIAGLLTLVQVVAWQPWSVRKAPLLWVLYTGHAALGAGLLLAAVQASGMALRPAWAVHVIAILGLSVLVIGMVTRTALGHLGRPLRADRLMVSCYALVIAAAVLRLVALLPTAWTVGTLHASAGAWMLAFGIYVWRFAPMLIRPRVDQAAVGPGPTAIRPSSIAVRR